MLVLPLTLLFFSWGTLVNAGDMKGNETCSVSNQRLQIGTYQFTSDCTSMFWCNTSSICDWKGCRRNEFPYGYSDNVELPPRCDTGYFCPDEEDACQTILPVGSPCQFNRDDQCEGPPDHKELTDHTGFGLNVNGSVCLSNVCMWANVTAGSPCIVQNTAYIAYSKTDEFNDIISRDNCRVGLYCDSQSLVCMQTRDVGASCDADKQCLSYNCLANGVCGKPGDTPSHVPGWVYAIVGICIFGGMFGTLFGMFCLHRNHRQVEKEKRLQYWREQNAFRQNIMQMQETARHSIMSLPTPGGASQRSTMYSREGVNSEDSQLPMLAPQSKSSALRHQFSDEGLDGSDESIVIQRVDRKDQGRF